MLPYQAAPEFFLVTDYIWGAEPSHITKQAQHQWPHTSRHGFQAPLLSAQKARAGQHVLLTHVVKVTQARSPTFASRK